MGKRFIPREALNRLGAIFLEGIPKYGENNWKKGVFDKTYQNERLEHALDHLYRWIEGDREEDHLAKVMWFCATQLELERIERETDQRVVAEIDDRILQSAETYIPEETNEEAEEVVQPINFKTLISKILKRSPTTFDGSQ